MNGIDPAQQAAIEAVGAERISITDERYPPLLRTIIDPPPLLYARGDISLLQQPQLAVVGARKASAAGLQCAFDLAAAVATTGLSVTSGLALGVDGAAHRGALAKGGKTIAVMATGIEQVYPQRHRSLADKILGSGCLISEFPPGTPPLRRNFPKRNRIISGMTLGTLVIEAALPSGSLITATSAMEQGREVFALPWSISHKGGAGCLKLLRDGAKLVQSLEDILEELGPLFTLQRDLLLPAGEQITQGDECESKLFQLIGYEAISIDMLCATSGLPASELLAQLSQLEIEGSVVRCPGGYIRS